MENVANLSVSSRACPADPIYYRMICSHRQKRRSLQSYQSGLTTEQNPPTQLFSRIIFPTCKYEQNINQRINENNSDL